MDFTYDDNTFSDLHKEVHGWRPSNSLMVEWNERTPRQKQELWNALCDQLEDVMAEEKAAHERKLAAFEKFVEYNMRLGASTRRDAIRWIFDAEDISFDDPSKGLSKIREQQFAFIQIALQSHELCMH